MLIWLGASEDTAGPLEIYGPKENVDKLTRDFKRALDTSELFEIRLQRRFTWSNGQANPIMVHCPIFLCN